MRGIIENNTTLNSEDIKLHVINDFIQVGIGTTKQEIWLVAHENRIKGFLIGVGATFDMEL